MNMHFFLFSLLFSLPICLASYSWPNPYAKQIAAVRRRSGLSHHEYLEYHTLIHGAKAWNAPNDNNKPLAYIQDHIFDSEFGINSSNSVTPPYSGRDDITELYSKTESSFLSPPLSNYTEVVIGPDGINFNDLASAFSMFAIETFEANITLNPSCVPTTREPVTAFYWLMASHPTSNSSTFDNTTFAQPIMAAILSNLPPNTVYNASTHISIPDVDSRAYYGGYGLPTVNAILKFWLYDAKQAVIGFRNAQKEIEKLELGVDLEKSFVVFAREVIIWDLVANITFDIGRLEGSLDNPVVGKAFKGECVSPRGNTH
ncbi:hypothetical protein BGZ60DRAFT_424188 [Tricladium varicosporioides]|nr:hypothetical protein BGZ60DRAFT_424188 [Hymenoscyphus varicosporioides]